MPSQNLPSVPRSAGTPSPVLVTLVAGLSATWRDAVIASMAAQHPRAIVVEIAKPTSAGVEVIARDAGDGTIRDTAFIKLDHCCASCTLVGQLPGLLRLWARGSDCRILVGLPAAMEPSTLRYTLEGASSIDDSIALDSVVTAVDVVLLHSHLTGDDLLVERGLSVAEADRRSVAEVVSRQIEAADSVVLCNLGRLSDLDRQLSIGVVRHLAPESQVVLAGPGGEWPAPEDALPCTPIDRVRTVVWRAARPLHPVRFAESVERLVEPLLRSRGEICLANRATEVVGWESAGGTAAIGMQGEREDLLADVNELRLLGVDLDVQAITALLDACLLTDDELLAGPEYWTLIEDPFGDALGSPG